MEGWRDNGWIDRWIIGSSAQGKQIFNIMRPREGLWMVQNEDDKEDLGAIFLLAASG